MINSSEIIRPNPTGLQLKQHLCEGINCLVLGEGLWSDTEAMKAIIAEDNLNASVEMSTNEIEILSFMGEELASAPANSTAQERSKQGTRKQETKNTTTNRDEQHNTDA